MSDKKIFKSLTTLQATANGKPSEPEYLPILHGKATDLLAGMNSKAGELDNITGSLTITNDALKAEIHNFNGLVGTLGVSTHKLLLTAIGRFVENNHVGSQARELRETEVKIPVDTYALKCGYKVDQKPTATKEEEKKEATRAKNALKNAKRKITKDLEILFSTSLSWKENIRKQETDFYDVRLIEAKGIKSGCINIKFTQTFAEYLLLLPVGHYFTALLGVDERSTNAYILGYHMINHFLMDSNQAIGTAQFLKVKTLLSYTDLPDIKTVRKDRKSWQERIKEPLEQALDVLYKSGVLADLEEDQVVDEDFLDQEAEITEGWRYCKNKKDNHQKIPKEELITLSYEEWAETLIYFILKSPPDQTERLQRKEEEKRKRQKKTRQNTTKKGGNNNG